MRTSDKIELFVMILGCVIMGCLIGTILQELEYPPEVRPLVKSNAYLIRSVIIFSAVEIVMICLVVKVISCSFDIEKLIQEDKNKTP